MVRGLHERPLDFGWLEAALEAWLVFEDRAARRATVRTMAGEIVEICQMKRERVERAEAFLTRYHRLLSRAEKQDIFRLMAETLRYIERGGVRVEVTDDPIRLLRGGGAL